MAEEQKEPQGEAMQAQQVTTKEPQQVTQVTKETEQVTTKNPKKVEAGKRLAVHSHKKREEKKREEVQKGEGVNKYYGIGVVIAIGAIGGLGYYIYRSRKGEVPDRALQAPTLRNPPQQPLSN